MHMYHLQESGIASRFTYKLDEYFRHRDMTCECEERPGNGRLDILIKVYSYCSY